MRLDFERYTPEPEAIHEMTFFGEHIYPWLVDVLGDPTPIRNIRRQIIPLAQGVVLEIGVGSGANFVHYDSSKVGKLYALEPNPGMVKRARQRLRLTKLNVEFLNLPGEKLPLEEQSVDSVVSTFTLCTISGVEAAISGLRRALRPDGRLIFFELGQSPDPTVQRWQRLLEPFHHWFFQGLHLTRDIPALISQSGFLIDQMDQTYLARFPKSSSYCWWGTARPVLRPHNDH